MRVHRKKLYNGEIKIYFYLAMVGFEPTPTSTAAPSNTETTVIPSRSYIYTFQRNVSELYWVFFHLKKVTFLLSQYVKLNYKYLSLRSRCSQMAKVTFFHGRGYLIFPSCFLNKTSYRPSFAGKIYIFSQSSSQKIRFIWPSKRFFAAYLRLLVVQLHVSWLGHHRVKSSEAFVKYNNNCLKRITAIFINVKCTFSHFQVWA